MKSLSIDAITLYIVAVTAIYGISVILWMIHSLLLPRLYNPKKEPKWFNEDIQVRILTVDNRSVCETTAKYAADFFKDIHVICEKEMDDIEHAEIHVVPQDFKSKATKKGRALEWARQNIQTNKEYLLYIDEDTLITEFEGIPDVDICQFTETPLYSGSILTFYTEVYRVGYQTEQRSFNILRYPLYVWGGGVAIRRQLENNIKWDYDTITEDTNFAWRSARNQPITFATVLQKFRNQAPSTLKDLILQRRRWVSGTLSDIRLLPRSYQIYSLSRIINWALSPFVLLNTGLIYLISNPVLDSTVFIVLVYFELFALLLTTTIGVFKYNKSEPLYKIILAIPLTPILAFINGIGAIYGCLKPTKVFRVTPKVISSKLSAEDEDK